MWMIDIKEFICNFLMGIFVVIEIRRWFFDKFGFIFVIIFLVVEGIKIEIWSNN